jgi:hypothetical protein
MLTLELILVGGLLRIDSCSVNRCMEKPLASRFSKPLVEHVGHAGALHQRILPSRARLTCCKKKKNQPSLAALASPGI